MVPFSARSVSKFSWKRWPGRIKGTVAWDGLDVRQTWIERCRKKDHGWLLDSSGAPLIKPWTWKKCIFPVKENTSWLSSVSGLFLSRTITNHRECWLCFLSVAYKSWRFIGPWVVYILQIFQPIGVWRRPGQNRVTWKTPSSRAFVPLQEPVAVLASYVPHAQMPVWSNMSVVVHNLYFV